MKLRLMTLIVVLGLIASLFGFASPVEATSYGVAFISSVVYMNVGADTADVSFAFYAAGSGTPVLYPTTGTLPLAKYAAGSLWTGDVFKGTSFQGSVVVSSSQALSVVSVQTPPAGNAVKTRMLSNGFTAGTPSITVPTVRRMPTQVSIFSVQNADVVAADMTVKFFKLGVPAAVATDIITNLPPGSAKFYDMNTTFTTTTGAIPAELDGSVQVTAKQTGTTIDGAVVATSTEFDTPAANYKAYAFNGVPGGASKVYMPSAFCNFNQGAVTIGPINSYYALTNASDAAINITVNYANGGTGLTDSFTNIAAGNKAVSNGCADATVGAPHGIYSGSATVTATWAGTPGTGDPKVVAVGKIVGYGYSTAYEGVLNPPVSVALPYVRYSTGATWAAGTSQRVFLAIQNVGEAAWPIGSLKIDYYDVDGVLKGTHTNTVAVEINQKINDSAAGAPPANAVIDTNFGYGAKIGGGVIITFTATAPANAKMAVLARAQTLDSATNYLWSEDYIGAAILP